MKLKIIKVARYLKSEPRLVWRFQYQQQPKNIDVFVDADFAAKETMFRSTSGVACQIADRMWIQLEKCASIVHRRV